jgi:hypothetical protein
LLFVGQGCEVQTEDVFFQQEQVVGDKYRTVAQAQKEDLKKAWLRSGVEQKVCDQLFKQKNETGKNFSKRELMDSLYNELRNYGYNKRLEISRNFVRLLVEHSNFVPLAEGHRIDIAETCALKLKQIIDEQRKQADRQIKRKVAETKKFSR